MDNHIGNQIEHGQETITYRDYMGVGSRGNGALQTH